MLSSVVSGIGKRFLTPNTANSSFIVRKNIGIFGRMNAGKVCGPVHPSHAEHTHEQLHTTAYIHR